MLNLNEDKKDGTIAALYIVLQRQSESFEATGHWYLAVAFLIEFTSFGNQQLRFYLHQYTTEYVFNNPN